MNPTIVAELKPTPVRVSSIRASLSALLLSAAAFGCASKPQTASVPTAAALPFIENDFAQAVERASGSNLPLFVEVWAPW